MARQSGDATPVMDREAGKTGKAAKGAATALRQLSGPWGASFDGTDGHGGTTPGLPDEVIACLDGT